MYHIDMNNASQKNITTLKDHFAFPIYRKFFFFSHKSRLSTSS